MFDRTLDLEATLDSVRTVGLWLRDANRDAGVPYEVAFGLDLAVHEAVENVVRHGSHDGALTHLRLRFRCDQERVDVVIVDDGRAFDPLSVPAPTMPQRIEDVIPGGQGIHLMRHFTDEVRYRRERGQNVLTLARALPSRDGAMSGLSTTPSDVSTRPWPAATSRRRSSPSSVPSSTRSVARCASQRRGRGALRP